jgi:hypothetical protein
MTSCLSASLMQKLLNKYEKYQIKENEKERREVK